MVGWGRLWSPWSNRGRPDIPKSLNYQFYQFFWRFFQFFISFYQFYQFFLRFFNDFSKNWRMPLGKPIFLLSLCVRVSLSLSLSLSTTRESERQTNRHTHTHREKGSQRDTEATKILIFLRASFMFYQKKHCHRKLIIAHTGVPPPIYTPFKRDPIQNRKRCGEWKWRRTKGPDPSMGQWTWWEKTHGTIKSVPNSTFKFNSWNHSKIKNNKFKFQKKYKNGLK